MRPPRLPPGTVVKHFIFKPPHVSFIIIIYIISALSPVVHCCKLTCNIFCLSAQSFDAATHFDTLPELVSRTYNRPKRETLMKQLIQTPDDQIVKVLKSELLSRSGWLYSKNSVWVCLCANEKRQKENDFLLLRFSPAHFLMSNNLTSLLTL